MNSNRWKQERKKDLTLQLAAHTGFGGGFIEPILEPLLGPLTVCRWRGFGPLIVTPGVQGGCGGHKMGVVQPLLE